MIGLIPFITGITGSITHVMTGPDHLAAVTPFTFEKKDKAWKIGFYWGLGHLFGMLLIGLVFYGFKNYFNIEKFSDYSEFSVGFILIGIGLWALYKSLNKKSEATNFHVHNSDFPFLHKHKNGSSDHNHENSQAFAPFNTNPDEKLRNAYTLFSVGTIHGFAGIAHFILFLPVLGFSTNIDVITYIVGFAIGTVFAMVTYTFLVSKLPLVLKGTSNNSKLKYFRIISGFLAILVGLYWIFIN